MHNNGLQDVTAAVAKNHRKSIWKRIVSVLACIVVFCTTYALILPALTLERDAECGLEEHIHTEACYIKDDSNSAEVLVCAAETLGLHQHTDACIGMDGEYICGYSDFVIHSHNEYCYDENGVLVCTLPEIFPHTHTDSCYLMSEDAASELPSGFDASLDNGLDSITGHVHTDECYVNELGELICTLPTETAHVHTDECYLTTNELCCPLTEGEGHIHGEGCFDETGVLVCTVPESAGHTHTLECYLTSSTLICTLAEGEQVHVHTDECYAQNRVLVCGIPEEPSFVDGDSSLTFPEGDAVDSYATEGLPGEPSFENNITTEPFIIDDTAENGDRGEPICGMTEIIPHRHDDSCFDANGMLICGMTEVLEHIHTQDCMGRLDDSDELTCTIAEGDGAHFHTVEGGCFDEEGTLICEIPESEGHVHSTICYGNWILVCGMEEHTHTDECYSSDEPDADPEREVYCGKEAHTHAGECINENGVVVCTIEEHKHGEECYVDPYADLETFCGKVEHIHADECFDENGLLVCVIEEHIHTEECYIDTSAEKETFCGKIEHAHGFECYDDDCMLICTLEEHIHTEMCYTDKTIEEILGFEPMATAYLVETDLLVQPFMMVAMNVMPSGVEADFTDCIDKVTLQYLDGNSWKDAPADYTIKKGEQVRFKIAYVLPGHSLNDQNNTIKYQLPDAFKNVDLSGGSVYNGATKIGEFTVSDDNTIHITFLPSYVTSNSGGNAIIGDVIIKAAIDETKANDNKVTIDFNKDLNIEYNFDKTDRDWSNAWSEKSASLIDAKAGIIEYTVTVKTDSNGTTHTVSVQDEMTGVTFINDSVTVKQNGQPVNCTVNTSGNGFNIPDLPEMSANSEYVITYRAKLPDGSYDSTVDIDTNNNVHTSTKRNDNTEQKHDKSFDYKIEQTYLSKYGLLNGDSIDWTITVNSGKHDIGGYKLSDILDGVEFKGKVKMNGTEIDLPYTFPEGSTDTYVITYSTIPNIQVGQTSVKNTAELEPDDGKPKVTEDYTVKVIEQEYKPVTKTADSLTVNNNGTATVHYTVNISATHGDIPGPWEFNDYLDDNDNGHQYISEAQKIAIANAVSGACGTRAYTLTWLPTNDAQRVTGFKLSFNDKLTKGESIVFEFDVTGEMQGGTKNLQFGNKGEVHFGNVYSSSWDSIKYYPSLIKVDANNENGGENTQHEYYDKDPNKVGVLKWKIYVSPPADYVSGDLIVTESLPKGVSLTQFTSQLDEWWWWCDVTTVGQHTLDKDGKQYIYNTSINGSDIILTIPESLIKVKSSPRFVLEVTVKIDENFEFTDTVNNLPAATFANSVSLEYKNGTKIDTKTQTQTVTKDDSKPPISKTNGDIKDNIIPYTVIVNPDGLDLVENTDKLDFEDYVMLWLTNADDATQLKLDDSSIHVYEITESGDVEIDRNTLKMKIQAGTDKDSNNSYYRYSKITMKLPDSTPLKITYNYGVICDKLDAYKSLKNSASISGVVSKPEDSIKEVGFNIQEIHATGATGGLEFIKVDSENYALILKDVEFELYYYKDGEYTLAKDEDGNVVKYTPDPVLGKIVVNNVPFNTACYLKETKTPSGYFGLDDVWYFYIEDKNTKDYPVNRPANFVGNTYTGGQTVYIPNEKKTTEIEVEKKWLEDKTDKNVTSTRTGEIQFKLMRYVLDEKPSSGSDGVIVKCVVYGQNEWDLKWNDVIKTTEGKMPLPGSKIRITVNATQDNQFSDAMKPQLKINGASVEWTVKDKVKGILTYEFVANSDSDIYLMGNWLYSGDYCQFDVIDPDPPPILNDPQEIDIYTLSSADGWHKRIENLPKTGEVTDPITNETKTVYYTYFVEEITNGITDMVGEPVYSENNTSGLTTGTITITNTVDTAPKHELPSTGGGGVAPITALGGGVIGISLLLALVKRAQDKKTRESG